MAVHRHSQFAVGIRSVIPCVALAATLAAGCAGNDGERVDEGAQEITSAESSYVSDFVLDALGNYPAMKGKTWNVTHDNRFEGNWVLQTPMQSMFGQDLNTLTTPKDCTTNCDPDFALMRCATQSDCTNGGVCKPVLASVKATNGAVQSMCVGHSDALMDEWYSLMIRATKQLDVTSLTPPDGRFLAAVRNALTVLSAKPNPPRVRLLFGTFPVQGVVNTTTLIKDLTRDIPKSSPIDISVGAYRSSDAPPSWNHSKTVAIDGQEAIVGGHNMWTKHYLSIDPVHDTSIHLRGSAAGDAHRFANILWDYTCHNMTWVTWLTWSVWANEWKQGNISSNCPAPYALPAAEGAPTGTVISVGRLGTGIQTDGNQSDAAFTALIHAARSAVRMSLQDVGPVQIPLLGIPTGSWPDAQIDALADALRRNVDVYIVLSNLHSSTGGLSASEAQYANGWTLEQVGGHIKDYMASHDGYPRGDALTALVCSKLHIAPFRYGKDATWPDGVPFANHDKTIIVDEQAFYIGSQNFYPAGLQEFGFIVDDSRATAQYLARHWTNVWGNASPLAISGAGATSCRL